MFYLQVNVNMYMLQNQKSAVKTTGTVYGVNLISVISLVNCFRVRDPTTVAGKVFQILITAGRYEYL